MSNLISDSRITSIEQLDRSKSVLLDAHSLRVIAVELEDREVPTLTPSLLVQNEGGPWLAHVIQSVVLHEVIVVDSVLFDLHEVSKAPRLFPDVIKGLFIRDTVRELIGERLDNIPGWIERPPKMPIELWNRWLRLDSSEKPLLDNIHDHAPRLIPPEYVSDIEINMMLDQPKPIWMGVPGRLLNSSMTVARAHFYLELARELRIPLNIDPIRSTYLQSILDESEIDHIRSAPEAVVDFFVEKITATDEDFPFIFLVDIPPVAELVLRYAKQHRISLHAATLEIRNSENAKRFRKWCAYIFALREHGGLRARMEYAKAMKEFKKVCDTWAIDAGEGVDFKTRKLKLGDIPLVGKVLSVASMSEFDFKDPLIRPNSHYRYFLFLNDLLRAPS